MAIQIHKKGQILTVNKIDLSTINYNWQTK